MVQEHPQNTDSELIIIQLHTAAVDITTVLLTVKVNIITILLDIYSYCTYFGLAVIT